MSIRTIAFLAAVTMSSCALGEIIIQPANPTDNDPISITINSVWHHSGHPCEIRYDIQGSDIFLEEGGAKEGGWTMLSPYSLTAEVGLLAAGQYEIMVSAYLEGDDPSAPDNPWSTLIFGPDSAATFTVTPEPGSLVLLLAGAWSLQAVRPRRRRSV